MKWPLTKFHYIQYQVVHCSKITSHDLIVASLYDFMSIIGLFNHLVPISLPVTGRCQRCTIRMPSHMAIIRIVSFEIQVTWLVSNKFQSVPSHMAIKSSRIKCTTLCQYAKSHGKCSLDRGKRIVVGRLTNPIPFRRFPIIVGRVT